VAGFSETYLGKLRALVGDRLLLVPGTRIVIEDDRGRILLQHRADFGLWGLPGGNAEVGESSDQVIIREVAEETGLLISDVRPFGFSSNPRHETITYPNGHRCQFFVLMFYTRSFQGQATVRDDESLGVDWFAMDRLPELLPNMARSVEAYRRFKASGEFQYI
jgi:8-oxo-dGTP pyrophosphatase MutT (NUDIX family)